MDRIAAALHGIAAGLAALTLISCGAATKSSTSNGSGKAPLLDVQDPWSDPEADFPEARPFALPARSAAPAPPIVIRNATILTATGDRIERGTIVLSDGRIESISTVGAKPRPTPTGARVIDADGKFVTPGIIDTHSHIGVYSTPFVEGQSDGNEAIAPITSHARAEYGYATNDPAIVRAAQGGVTTALILPGSANLIGGRGFTVVMRPGRTIDEVRFPGAPQTVKMACGENPKRVYGDKGGPQTRMGEYAVFRMTFQQAAEYAAKWKAYDQAREVWLKKKARAEEMNAALEKKGSKQRVATVAAPQPPPRDARLDTLAGVLAGDILVQIHCYKATEIREMVAIASEFGFAVRSFHHALGAYKVRDLLVAHDIAISTWADWWGFKMEAFDGIPENAALFTESGGRAIIHSDSSVGIQRLNQEASKAYHAGLAVGIKLTENDALRWVTANPAWALGIDDVTGTLEQGKRADVVVWDKHPFSVYARADVVIAGGSVTYDRAIGLQPTDFELGNSAIDTDDTDDTDDTGGAQ